MDKEKPTSADWLKKTKEKKICIYAGFWVLLIVWIDIFYTEVMYFYELEQSSAIRNNITWNTDWKTHKLEITNKR